MAIQVVLLKACLNNFPLHFLLIHKRPACLDPRSCTVQHTSTVYRVHRAERIVHALVHALQPPLPVSTRVDVSEKVGVSSC